MSIVNDALKKAGKEFEFNDQNTSMDGRHGRLLPNYDKKWITIMTVSLFIIASLFGSLVLYKNISRSNTFAGMDLKSAPASVIQSTLNNMEQKSTARGMKPQDVVKLNGIVYGEEGRWAIVNNRIVKEGDSLLGGEVVTITKDLVRIEKNDGSELTLSLK